MDTDLPFIAEYAASGRASCKKCKQKIARDSLRIAVMVQIFFQSRIFDGNIPLWYHRECFFMIKNQLQNISQIANFDNLRWDDQQNIKKHLAKYYTSDIANNGVTSSANSDLSVEYAKSSRSVCRGCEQKITKGEVCISRLDDDPTKQHYGPTFLWYHVDCFLQRKHQIGFIDSVDKLHGYNALTYADQTTLNEKIYYQGMKKVANDESTFRMRVEKPNDEQTKILEEQNQILFEMRDKILQPLPKNHMIKLLEHNKQYMPTSNNKLLDHLADCMVFGALKACPDCKNEALSFMNNKYICSGNLSEWSNCQFETKFPERKKFEVPDYLQHKFTDYKCVVRERMLATTDEAPSPIKKILPLNELKIVLLGNFQSTEENVRKQLQELGAKVQKTITDKVDLCVVSPEEIDSNMSKIGKARPLNIHVVSDDFIKDIIGGSTVVQAVQNNLLSPWGDDPFLKFGLNPECGKQILEAKKDKSFSQDLPEKVTVTVKGAAAVDVESGLQHTCQVYQKGGDIYSAVLAYVDASTGKNSFYKLQVLKANSGSSYYLFRQWGRVGTRIGGKKIEHFYDDWKPVRAFEKLYYEQTENHWHNRKNFQKKPGRKYPLEVDYGQDSEEFQQKLKAGENSKLSKPVQELICLIFDQDAMMMTMIEFEIDLKKMPLGKISEKQIAMAYEVLGEAQEILARDGNKSKITEVSNRFFTLIPHNFGLKKPPLLDNEKIIKSKIEMLDSLLQIGIAYSIIKDQTEKEDPIDMHYGKLKADIEAVGKDTEEYLLVEKYLKNTHAPTHNQYILDLLEVFRVNRHGESENYRKFKGLHNKKLLWHGSRVTNFVGILSQGLRIAPPEAPVSGYMFGKGVYFADMVSKSANYCSAIDSTGLLLLCEVALGNMYKKTHSEYIEKLPDGKHSTLGMGITIPDPTEKSFIGDVEVPYGRPIQRTDMSDSRLLYNEYIVYDTSQINIKYLLKVNFSSVRY
ncbi:unnamed protein product [Larinioides sclopetarius]|uniref:Poly [ADP-ribose] polymerase n=1 Tax=Larinioides sclopetarius TaxID=280406 RepID=A0AAV2B8D0_9ARAC